MTPARRVIVVWCGMALDYTSHTRHGVPVLSNGEAELSALASDVRVCCMMRMHVCVCACMREGLHL